MSWVGIKSQEKKFKQTCQAEMEQLDDKIEKLEGSGVEILDDERTRAIAKQYADDQEKLKKIKMLAARRTREIANLHRKIDEFPGRAELNQVRIGSVRNTACGVLCNNIVLSIVSVCTCYVIWNGHATRGRPYFNTISTRVQW